MPKFTNTLPWKGFRFANHDQHDNNLGRHHPPGSDAAAAPARRSEQIPRLHQPEKHQSTSRLSESTSKSPLAGVKGLVSSSPLDNPTFGNVHPETSNNHSAARRNRFSLMRFRHASDPQLSASYQKAEDAPPVPPPPTIITTSPTVSDLEGSKSNHKANTTPKPPLHHAASDISGSKTSNGGMPPSIAESAGSPPAPSSMRASHISFEEPGRLSTNSLRSNGARGYGEAGNPSGFPQGTRLSESSRSDASSGENGVYRGATKNGASSSSHSLFRFPRLKKSRSPLFPLLIKMDPPTQEGNQSGPQKSASSMEQSREQPSPIPSPSRSSLGLSTPPPGPAGPTLFRKDSVRSSHSARSSPSLKQSNRKAGRGRSSTLNSLADIQDDPQQSSPELVPSSRTSTYTGARKSIGDLFSLSHRFRQNSEPPGAGERSPMFGGPTTPASVNSKTNSFTIQREAIALPPKEEGDTPAIYLSRLEGAVRRGAIAAVLSQSNEDFYTTALRRYMRGFSFFGDPIDMSIRKLLMEVELPKETQHIDRVIQSFADRYHECNPGIFASTDQAYFIAFSLLILHTDVFNKNNKRKMQKQDYVRNAHGEGVHDEILECFYENISYTPFIHVEDDINLGARLMPPKSRTKALFKVPSSDHLSRSSKDPVDPYALILDGKLSSLKPNLKDVMELEDVYSFWGPGYSPDMSALHNAFHRPCVLQIVSARSRPDAFMTQSTIANPADSHPGLVDIRVARVGLLWRKEPQKKKTRSPWQEWGAILTGSQLYFFRDVQWVKSLLSQYEMNQRHGRHNSVTFKPPLADFRPDAVISTHDAVALLDSSYKKHKHAFLLVRHGGVEEVFLANTEAEMNDWVAILNYAAAFRTAGVRMRGANAANYEGQRTTRADSVTSEASAPTSLAPIPGRRMDPAMVEEVSAARRELMAKRIKEANEKLQAEQKGLDDLLRNARHLQILTPIHPRARDLVVLGAGRMSAKIKWARLDMWRTKCHREMLSLDLADEERILLSTKGSTRGRDRTSRPSISNSNAPAKPNLKLESSVVHSSPKSDTFQSGPSPSTPLATEGVVPPESTAHATPLSRNRGGRRRSAASSEASVPPKATMSKSEPSLSSPSNNRAGSVGREASVASSHSRADDSSCAIAPSNQSTPTPSIAEDNEERLLREAGILDIDSSPFTEKLGDNLAENNSGDHRGGSKVRRSLHRTLREAHHMPHHHRSKKGKDSGTLSDDGTSTAESEVLSRGAGSFTVHGKKASVITFGTEWQNMSPEERLKLRKPMQASESKSTDTLSTDERTTSFLSEPPNNKRAQSLRTPSGMTVPPTQRRLSAPADVPPAALSKADPTPKEMSIKSVDPVAEEGAEPFPEPDGVDEEDTPREGENLKTPVAEKDPTTSTEEKDNNDNIPHTASQEELKRIVPQQAVNA